MNLVARIALGFLFTCAAFGATPFKVLVFSKTAGFRHDSIPAGIAMIQSLGTSNNFAVTATENSAQFNQTNLQQFACVVFLSTTGDVLNDAQQTAFERYIRAGGGYVGIHAASDTEYAWPWYGELVGAYFKSHPAIQPAVIRLNDFAHPSTEGLPKRWQRTDEWYSFNRNPRGAVHVIATLDENSYTPLDRMGFDHPISWCQSFQGGRAWYTGAGHTIGSYTEPFFRKHVLGGILWAAGAREGDAGATLDSNYEKIVIDEAPRNPMQLTVAPDGRVFYIEREGALKIWKPDTRTNILAGELVVYAGAEDGLLGIVLDPQFSSNNWIYLFYSPQGVEQKQHISRFEMDGDNLLISSEKIVLTIPTDRGTCCHSGGGLEFDSNGNLYIGVGDNTNPFESDGFAPIDERPGRAFFDAQRTAANANDLRGKILRIHPENDGSYTIPAGNLFPPGTPNTRPEIYVMGNRNPFRISIDSETGWLYWGEVGPDSLTDVEARGPRGHDEWNQARGPGHYGWPYFVGNNKSYRDYNFETLTNGAPFDPSAPMNQSPANTGPQSLPPARPAWIWYPYDVSMEFPELGSGGRCAMAGPIYHYIDDSDAAGRLPRYFDKTLFIFDWARNFFKEVKIDDNGDVLKINPFLPSFSFNAPIDMDIGPDGDIYVAEWGWNFSGTQVEAKVSRIVYVGPTVLQSANTVDGIFTDEFGVKYNAPTKSFSVPLGAGDRFFRIRAEVNRTIRSAVRSGDTLQISID